MVIRHLVSCQHAANSEEGKVLLLHQYNFRKHQPTLHIRHFSPKRYTAAYGSETAATQLGCSQYLPGHTKSNADEELGRIAKLPAISEQHYLNTHKILTLRTSEL
jgi:hypothetical protein